MTFRVALVEFASGNNSDIITSSGILFAESFVLITGHVLLPFLKQFGLENWFNNHDAGIIHHSLFKETIWPKLNVVTKNECIIVKPAEVIAGFICQNIKKSCKKYLKDWAVEFENDTFHTKELLSLFFILKLHDGFNNNSTKEKTNLNEALLNLLSNAENFMSHIGQEIFIESVPFGNRLFLNSYSQGIISNIVGEKACFLLTDCPSVPGSEGSPVFIKTQCRERRVIAIVISCINWWRGEWVGLTLTANLVPLLEQFSELRSNVNRIYKNRSFISPKLIDTVYGCLVQVTSKSLWGTAILINKQKGIFLTNSHVVASSKVVLHWQNHHSDASVIYRTPNADVYDLAVLQCNPVDIQKLSIEEAKISLTPVHIGEDVFSAGFPLFQYELNVRPTLTKGSIGQVHKGMLTTTCCVLPGTSGGAIFRSNCELAAVIVSNVKINETGVVYPRANMSIPILAVYSVLQEFLATGEVDKLLELHSKDSDIVREWNYLPSKL